MKNPFKIAYRWIKNKLKGDSVTIPTTTISQRLSEFEIQSEVRRIFKTSDVNLTINLLTYNNSVDYWVNFITAICFAESNYDRFTKYMEPAPLNYYSIGLMQLSYVDQKYHTHCDIQGDKIFEVHNNLYCGIGILNKLVGKNKKPIF